MLDNVTLRVAPGRTLAVIGPNGAGKSTLLETIAGLLTTTAGRIVIGGVDCTKFVPERRSVGYLVQDYALFPHLTVRENVRFGMPPGLRRAHFDDELLARLQIEELATRRPECLSGGERQRVALARALATDAKVLLFDEPFAALDVTLRPALRADLRAMLAELDVPAVFVTHDQAEARVLAHDVAILRDGRLAQIGPVDEVFAAPADPFVAAFVGVENRWPGVVESVLDGVAIVRLDEAPLSVVASSAGHASNARVIVCIRAEDVELATDGVGDGFPVRSAVAGEPGPFATLRLDCGIPVVVYLPKRDAAAAARVPVSHLRIHVPPAHAWLVPAGAPDADREPAPES